MLDFNLNLGEEPAAQAQPRPEVENVIIIGSGPAGWSAAIYTARADLRPLLITGNELGGQIALTTEVENFPGFDEAIQGPGARGTDAAAGGAVRDRGADRLCHRAGCRPARRSP